MVLFNSQMNLSLLILLFVICNFSKLAIARDITCEVNPNCKSCINGSDINLVHLKSNGQNDSLNFLLITGISNSSPSVIVSRTPLNDNLTIDWSKLNGSSKDIHNAIHFNHPFNSIGFEISRLYFFDDVNKTGAYKPGYNQSEIEWNKVDWAKIECSKGSIVKLTQRNKYINGTIELQMAVAGQDERGDVLPHLAYTSQSTLLQINLIGVEIKNFRNPKLMTDITVAVPDIQGNQLNKVETITSMNDEYTPGVFDRLILQGNSSHVNGQLEQSFIEWKPISYSKNERIIANTLDVFYSGFASSNLTNASLALNAYFNKSRAFKYSYTFGNAGDPPFNKTSYNSFSIVLGVGQPPDQFLSFLVKIIILVGFGLPVIVTVLSALWLVVQKYRKRNDNLLNR